MKNQFYFNSLSKPDQFFLLIFDELFFRTARKEMLSSSFHAQYKSFKKEKPFQNVFTLINLCLTAKNNQ